MASVVGFHKPLEGGPVCKTTNHNIRTRKTVMSRKYLSLGVSALALTLVASSYAEAQQNLPTINVGGARKTLKRS